MLKIKDNVDLKELEKYGYEKHRKEGAIVDYYKFSPIGIIRILKDRIIDIQFPFYSSIPPGLIKIESFISDLIQDGLVEKVEE